MSDSGPPDQNPSGSSDQPSSATQSDPKSPGLQALMGEIDSTHAIFDSDPVAADTIAAVEKQASCPFLKLLKPSIT